MKVADIKIGEFYRVKGSEKYCWAKPVEILPPKKGDNPTNATLVKCEWVVDKTDKFGLVKYFKASSLIKSKEQ